MKHWCVCYHSMKSLVNTFLQNNAVFHKSYQPYLQQTETQSQREIHRITGGPTTWSGRSNNPELIDENVKQNKQTKYWYEGFCNDVFCGSMMKKSIFINMKNCLSIEHNPSCTGAKWLFYGTSISIFQNLDSEIPTRSSFKLDKSVSSCKNIASNMHCYHPRLNWKTTISIIKHPLQAYILETISLTEVTLVVISVFSMTKANHSMLFMLIFIQSKHWKMIYASAN